MLVLGKRLIEGKSKHSEESYNLETIDQSDCSSLIKYSQNKLIFKLDLGILKMYQVTKFGENRRSLKRVMVRKASTNQIVAA